MRVRDGFAQAGAVLTNLEGKRRIFAVYGFYADPSAWRDVKDERVGQLFRVSEFPVDC